jgi:hypothetical protein
MQSRFTAKAAAQRVKGCEMQAKLIFRKGCHPYVPGWGYGCRSPFSAAAMLTLICSGSLVV